MKIKEDFMSVTNSTASLSGQRYALVAAGTALGGAACVQRNRKNYKIATGLACASAICLLAALIPSRVRNHLNSQKKGITTSSPNGNPRDPAVDGIPPLSRWTSTEEISALTESKGVPNEKPLRRLESPISTISPISEIVAATDPQRRISEGGLSEGDASQSFKPKQSSTTRD